MAESKLEELYLNAIKNLKTSLPKIFTLFLSLFLLYLFFVFTKDFASNLYFKYKDINIEASKILTIITLSFILIVLVMSFGELELLSLSLACLLVYHSSRLNEESTIIESRIKKWARSFKQIFYCIAAFIVFLIFKDFIFSIHPNLPFIIFVSLSIWFMFSLWFLSASFVSEIEEKIWSKIYKALKKKK